MNTYLTELEVSINDIINILSTTFLGFIIAYYINFKHGKKPHRLQELILIMKKNCYHIHHFITFGGVILFMLIGRYMSSKLLLIMIAFLIGLSLEDLIYKDWGIIKNNCHKSKLIKFMKNTTDVNSKYN